MSKPFFGFSLLMFAVALGYSILSPQADAQGVQCVSCHDVTIPSGGWFESPSGCGTQCQDIQNKSCRQNCIDTVAHPILTASPGMTLDQRNGKLIVSSVIPDSPAALAGIQVSDEIYLINGRPPGSDCQATGWFSATNEKKDYDDLVSVGYRRQNRDAIVSLQLVPLDVLLVHLWQPNTLANVDSAIYTLGIQWSFRPGTLKISSVLKGGAAYSAGIRVGDEILFIDGIPAISAATHLIGQDHSFSVSLNLQRENIVRKFNLTAGTLFAALEVASRPDTRAFDQTLAATKTPEQTSAN